MYRVQVISILRKLTVPCERVGPICSIARIFSDKFHDGGNLKRPLVWHSPHALNDHRSPRAVRSSKDSNKDSTASVASSEFFLLSSSINFLSIIGWAILCREHLPY